MRTDFLLAGSIALVSLILLMIAATGSLSAMLLAYLTPLPLLLLGLSTKHHCSGLAGAIAAFILFFIANPLTAIGYLIIVAAPVAFLSERALRAPISGVTVNGPNNFKGHAAGQLCALLTFLPCILLTIVFLYFHIIQGVTLESILSEKADIVVENYRLALVEKDPNLNPAITDQLILLKDNLLNTVPALLALFWMVVIFMNGLIAQYTLVRFSANARDSLEMNQIELPQWVVVIFLISILLAALLNGGMGSFSTNLAAILAFPILLSGLGVVHIIADKSGHRTGALFAVYLIITLSRWAALILVLVGVLDHFIKMKDRLRKVTAR
jgi:uncharacterized protein YybS (DUF2232 family)